MRIGRCTAAEKAQVFERRDLVPGTGRNENRISLADRSAFPVHLHFSPAGQKEVELLRKLMVMAVRRSSGRKRRLGQALIPDRGVGRIQNAADGRAVPRREGSLMMD